MGAAGCSGAFGVTLQLALALIARGFCSTRRELNLRPPPMAGPAAPGYGLGESADLPVRGAFQTLIVIARACIGSVHALRGDTAQLLRVSRKPPRSRTKERVRTKARIFALTTRSDHHSSPASATVGAPTSGASRRRAGPPRAQRSEHAGPCRAVQRRGNPTTAGHQQRARRMQMSARPKSTGSMPP